MALIIKVPEKNLWEEICNEARSQRPPFPDADAESTASTEKSDYDPAKHSPVFYGRLFHRLPANDGPIDFDPSVGHPAACGYALLDRPEAPETPAEAASPPPDKRRCSPRQYLESFVFPTLLPAMEAMLRRAGEERCFERKRTKFNASDFLTEYLYAHNPAKSRSPDTKLEDIPFVKEEWEKNPRPPLPLSVLLSDQEAVQIIQNYWRGYQVRRDPTVQELRQWQREWRETNRDARSSVSQFWRQRMGPDDAEAAEEAGAVDGNNGHDVDGALDSAERQPEEEQQQQQQQQQEAQ